MQTEEYLIAFHEKDRFIGGIRLLNGKLDVDGDVTETAKQLFNLIISYINNNKELREKLCIGD